MNAEDRYAVTASYGTRWPGLAPGRELAADPDSMARQYAARLLSRERPLRLGLVAADRGADALAAAGWTGPLNYTNDTGQIAAIARSWEERFGARVVGVGFADLYLSVAAPPATMEEALPVAAEHFAFCPDNIWGGHPDTLTGYAGSLAGASSWEFWWDLSARHGPSTAETKPAHPDGQRPARNEAPAATPPTTNSKTEAFHNADSARCKDRVIR